MASYELRFKRSVSKDLQKIPPKDVQRILEVIGLLAVEPRGTGSKKLSEQNFYRVRLGQYRFIYEILDEQLTVQVIRVAHRSKVYLS